MKGRSSARASGKRHPLQMGQLVEAAEKSSGSPARSPASTRKNRASKRRGRPGGVIARKTNWSGSAAGRCPRRRNPPDAAAGLPGQRSGRPRIKARFLPEFADRGRGQRMLRGSGEPPRTPVRAQGAGSGVARGTAHPRHPPRPRERRTCFGMKAAPVPRCPISTWETRAVAQDDHGGGVADGAVLSVMASSSCPLAGGSRRHVRRSRASAAPTGRPRQPPSAGEEDTATGSRSQPRKP